MKMNKKLLEEKTARAEEIIYSYLPEKTEYTDGIISAMEYSVKAGGKRLRPILMAETYIAFADIVFPDRDESSLLKSFMAAIEFIHTYSLIHDDLPAMDNDELRRGKPTNHMIYGEAGAILAGDGLLNLAFETMAIQLAKTPSPEEQVRGVRAMALLAWKAGHGGMVGGQSLDVANEKSGKLKVDQKTLEFIYKNKTGALIEGAMMAGAILGGASMTDVSRVEEIAGCIGMAFQIRDDILDVESTAEVLGKPIGSDLKNEKTTWVTLYGPEGAKAEAERYTEMAVQGLEFMNLKDTFLYELTGYLSGREK